VKEGSKEGLCEGRKKGRKKYVKEGRKDYIMSNYAPLPFGLECCI
jgi:hypothetical protein